MHLIPVPELVVALLVGLVVLGLRTLWRIRHVPSGRGAVSVRQPPEADLGAQRKRAQLIAQCVLLVIISVPLVLRMVPPNGAYGFRTGLTQSSSAIWYPVNAFMGWALIVAAVISAILLLILPATVKRWLLWATFLVPVFGAVVASFVYLNRLS
jgi:SdpI/YfhL protein family